MAAIVGSVTEITRYPVKSFAGESLSNCKLEPYGFKGDRLCAFCDPAKQGWASFVTARELPVMLAYRAAFVGGRIQVTSPEGRTYEWDEGLLKDLQRFSEKQLSMKSFGAPHPDDPKLMSVDQASILILTDATLKKLETLWGKRLDPRRFRANMIVSLENGSSEDDWIGKRLSIGSAELLIDEFCERCSMITIDPDTLERDPSLLRQVHDGMQCTFGVYASVVQPGQVAVGDRVYRLD